MKKVFPYLLIGYISVIGGFNCASAQKVQNGYKFKDINFEKLGQAYEASEGMEPLAANPNVKPVSISKKVLKDFKRSFKDAINESWFETKEGNLVVNFSANNIQTRVFYHKNGRQLATILDYSEENLPKNIRHLVRSTYYDYSIFHIAEVTIDGQKAYLISLEDKTSWKHIRVIEEEIIEDSNYQKG